MFSAPCVIPAKWRPCLRARVVERCAAHCLCLGRKQIGAEFCFLFYISAGAVTSLITLGSIVFLRVFLLSAKRHPRLRARVVERLLCCCDYRVVLRCAAHPPRAGGLSSPQHFLCEEMLGAPSAPYIHVGAPMISRAARIHGVHSRQRAGVCRAFWKARGRVKG